MAVVHYIPIIYFCATVGECLPENAYEKLELEKTNTPISCFQEAMTTIAMKNPVSYRFECKSDQVKS